MKKRGLPNEYIEIIDDKRKNKGELHTIRFLLELDMSTHDNRSFGREKISRGIACFKSNAYKERFSFNSGYWLVVTNGEMRRVNHLMLQTREIAKQDFRLFFFTSISQMQSGKPLTSSIWRQVGMNEPKSLLISRDN